MSQKVDATIEVLPDKAALSEALAEVLLGQIQDILGQRERCTLCLSGGSTPRLLYEVLAQRSADAAFWKQVHFFWGDDRFVDHDNPQSNVRMAREALLSKLDIPAQNIHPMPTHYAIPGEAAVRYEKALRELFEGEWPRMDLLLLGLGTDGHTASLFPGTAAVDERERWVAVGQAPVAPRQRLTLTLPVLNHAHHVHFLIAGANKAEPFAALRREAIDPQLRPAGAVQPIDGTLTYWLDQAASEPPPP